MYVLFSSVVFYAMVIGACMYICMNHAVETHMEIAWYNPIEPSE